MKEHNAYRRFLRCLSGLFACILLLLAGCSADGWKEDTRKVLKIGEETVIADTYRYFYLNYGMQLAGAADYNFDVAANHADIQASAVQAVRDMYAVYHAANAFDFEISRTTAEQMDVQLAEWISGDEEAFLTMCRANYATGDLMRLLEIEIPTLRNQLYDYLVSDGVAYFPADRATVLADIETNFYRCEQIFISYENTRAKAEEVLADITSGKKTFTEYAAAYANLPGQSYQSDRYYRKGEAHTAFEEAALTLAVGEMSGIVETAVGYHILVRRPMEPLDMEQKYTTLKETYLSCKFAELLEKYAVETEVSYMRKFDAVSKDLVKELTAEIATKKAAQTTTAVVE